MNSQGTMLSSIKINTMKKQKDKWKKNLRICAVMAKAGSVCTHRLEGEDANTQTFALSIWKHQQSLF